MKFSIALSLLPLASAFPAAFDNEVVKDASNLLAARQKNGDALGISKARTNCGPIPCTSFNLKKQFVSTTGQHAYASPATDEIRGPCPGLNAAANHGYLPRSGIASIEETISGLGAAYGLTAPACAFLAAYAVALDGNIVEGVWSIGGPLPTDELTGAVLGTGQGLSYSHNNYEGDSSIGRPDAYVTGGDAHTLDIEKFRQVYKVGGKEDRYTLDKFAQRFEKVQEYSIHTNPYYFTGLFSTVVVVPAAYNFVINLMSNHSKEEPSGYLDGYMFKQFFAVEGDKVEDFKWKRGQERIPENWYRRPLGTEGYGLQQIGGDVGISYAAYPKTLKFGGNTGKKNSFVGVNVKNVSGGVFDAENLFKGNNFACFAFGLAQQGLPDFLSGKGDAGKIQRSIGLVEKHLKPFNKELSCPQLGKQEEGLFAQFPGRTYKPKGKDTNYKN